MTDTHSIIRKRDVVAYPQDFQEVYFTFHSAFSTPLHINTREVVELASTRYGESLPV